jgi:acyl carrier protein
VTPTAIEAVLAEVLAGVAPEADLHAVPRGAVLRDALDLDSMDLLTLYAGLCQRLQIEIPEADYPQLATLDGLVAYVGRKAR